jgi:hypothetical protein
MRGRSKIRCPAAVAQQAGHPAAKGDMVGRLDGQT